MTRFRAPEFERSTNQWVVREIDVDLLDQINVYKFHDEAEAWRFFLGDAERGYNS